MDIYKIINRLPDLLKRQKIIKLLLFFSPESRIQLVRFNTSAKLFADLYDPDARAYFLDESFEPEFFSVAKLFLLKGGVFFDVGANFGFCSFGMMAYLPQTDIEYHLFEANSYLCELLKRSQGLYPGRHICVNNYCVTDHDGASLFYIDKYNFGKAFICAQGTQKARNIVLDDYIKEKSIRKVNFLKIDIEGSEPAALRGLNNSLSSGIIEVIFIEISTINLARSGFSVKDCFEILEQTGYRLFYVKEADFSSGIAKNEKALTLQINGFPLKVSELDSFPDNYQTDMLAIRENSDFLRKYQKVNS